MVSRLSPMGNIQNAQKQEPQGTQADRHRPEGGWLGHASRFITTVPVWTQSKAGNRVLSETLPPTTVGTSQGGEHAQDWGSEREGLPAPSANTISQNHFKLSCVKRHQHGRSEMAAPTKACWPDWPLALGSCEGFHRSLIRGAPWA